MNPSGKYQVDTKSNKSEQELQTASLYVRSLIEASLDPLVTINPQGKITDVNKATEQVTGIPRERLIGSDFSDYFTDAQKAREGYQTVLSLGLVKDYPLTIRHVLGHTTDVLYNATVYRNEAGVVQGVFAAARDITELKAAEKRQSITNTLTGLFARKNSRKEYLDSTVEVIRDWSGCRCIGIRYADTNGCIPYEACIGFDSEFQETEGCLSLTGDACFCVRAITQKPDERDRPVTTSGGSFCCSNIQSFAQILTPSHPIRYRDACIRRGFKSLAIVPIRYREKILAAIQLADEREGVVTPGKVGFIESFAPLIGEAIHRFNAEAELARHREHLEELVKQRTLELRSLNEELELRVAERTAVAERRAEQLRQLAAELTLAEQREQKRLAQVLHDGLQQTLVAAKFNLALIERGKKEAVAETEILINEAIEISRSLTAELSPPMLHQGGLVPSLKWLTRWFHDRHGLTVKLTARNDMEPMPEEVIVQLFQSIRELLFNVVKHSGVQAACVEVAQREGRIFVSIEDDGAGFDTRHLRAKGGSSGGFGLFSISERISFLGGQMEIQSVPGKGSRFKLVVPYSAAKSLKDHGSELRAKSVRTAS
jgi:PAS domain S-box-containing protein